jgi:glutamate/aspartate transport system substrate-binding protein
LNPAISCSPFPSRCFRRSPPRRLPKAACKRIKDTKTIAIAHRADASPHAMLDDAKQPTGYMIDLCKRVVASLETAARHYRAADQVGARHDPDALRRGRARRRRHGMRLEHRHALAHEAVDFSNYTFIESTGLLTRRELNARSIVDLAGKKIGVVGGTTNESALREALKQRCSTRPWSR